MSSSLNCFVYFPFKPLVLRAVVKWYIIPVKATISLINYTAGIMTAP